MLTHCDIAIVGAGPAGAVTARRLAQSGCRVVLLERSRFDGPRVGESLAPTVQPLLTELGVWPRFINLQPLPCYGTRSVWGAAQEADQSYLQTPYLCGWHVDRLGFDQMLANSAVDASAQLLLGVQNLRCVSDSQGRFVLSFENADGVAQLRADFVIDASGRGSFVARRLGAQSIVFDRLVGVAAQFEDVRARERCYTLVETTLDGWWYSAPAGNASTVTILMTDGDLICGQGTKELSQWRNALDRAQLTRAGVDGCDLKWGPRVFSAVSQRLRRNDDNKGRWLAVGDAALAVDPISGSGVVRALQTARAAAETVLLTLAGDVTAIACYEAERDKECTEYLLKRARYYQMERRWPTAPFWQRRVHAYKQVVSENS